MVVEENLIQYGALGLWTICNLILIKYLLVKIDNQDERERITTKELLKVISQNTTILKKVHRKLN